MAHLPFYLPASRPPDVTIIGGGYAGIAALVSLHRYCPGAQVSIVDPSPDHVKVTHLHETFRRNAAPFRIPFHQIAARFGCRHVAAAVSPNLAALAEWWSNRGLSIGDDFIAFDAMIVSAGAAVATTATLNPDTYEIGSFLRRSGHDIMVDLSKRGPGWITVVGAGATGIQVLFEIAHWIRVHDSSLRLRLVDGEQSVLKQFAPPLGRYVESRMAALGIVHVAETFFISQGEGVVRLQQPGASCDYEIDSLASFVFSGKRPESRVVTNIFGQVLVDGRPLPGVFAAGDCAEYRGPGSNALTAQAAVRKGKLAARNLLRGTGRLRFLEPYLHRDMGYVVSLGPDDAIGWLALERNVVAGFPALVVKELVESQYDLLLAGIDTYVL